MHALSLYFPSAACFGAFIAVPNTKFFLALVCVLFLASYAMHAH